MATTSDPEDLSRLYEAPNERILAKDKKGAIEVYYELLRLGRPMSEIMDRADHAEDGPPPGAPDLADEAARATADATILNKPPEPLVEPASAIIAAPQGETPDWPIDPAPAGETSPIAGDTADHLPSPAPVAQPARQRGATARLSPIFRLGAIVAAAGIGALVLHPAAQKVTPGGAPADEVAVGAPAGTSPIADAAATPPAQGAAASDAATGGAATAEPGPAPAATTDAASPPDEPAPSALPAPEAPQRDTAVAATPPTGTAEPAEPAPPPPDATSRVAAPAPSIAPGRSRLATVDVAVLLARGDALLGAGDITSARLFYERASDAGDGRAALRLGATYDPGFLDQVRLPHLKGDLARALSWYRRARDLGESEAERWIQALESKSAR